ncbi:hypothetical protein [Pedobacter sp.]|uniref:hypothetical protein n=1 Tax=Pedobacter sp. TaxID=1411316 RepID=UPI003D7FB340
MKIKICLAAILISASVLLHAQDRPTYRPSYLRLGVNAVGNQLDKILSPRENILDGRFGAVNGFVLDAGRIYYFGGKFSEGFLNLGLDWTVLSFTYNQLNEWEQYGRDSRAQNVIVDGTKVMASASTKLGPVLSINLIEKIVIDARFQLAPTFRYIDLSYYEDEGGPNERFITFIKNGKRYFNESFDFDGIKDRTTFSVAKSLGVTLRRNTLGISADYIWGDVKTYFESIAGDVGIAGKQSVPVRTLQVKLNLSF